MDKDTGAERRPRGGDGWLACYRPQRMDAKTWSAVQPFVVGAARLLELDGGAGARRVVRVLGRLTAWVIGEGLPLDLEVVLDPDMVERFIAVGLLGDQSRATYRAVLRRWSAADAAGAMGGEAGAGGPAAGRVAVQPGRAQWVAGRRSCAANARSCPGRSRPVGVVPGVGLDGRWVAAVRADDVLRSGDVVVVRVGEPSARAVPVLAMWEDEVLDLAATAGDEFLIGGRSMSRIRASALAASLVAANGHARFSASRLRSTWLVTHLTMGTRLPELAAAAGLQGATVLSDLLPFVPALDDGEALAMLRGAW